MSVTSGEDFNHPETMGCEMKRLASMCSLSVLFLVAVVACSGGNSGEGDDPSSPTDAGSPDAVSDAEMDGSEADTSVPDDSGVPDDGSSPPSDVPQEDDGGTRPDSEPGSVDSDYDGLTDEQESELCGGSGSNPNKSDTDGDGVSDYEEYKAGTSPCKKDTDGDGATDYQELVAWPDLNPNNRITYDDGTLDGERWILHACDNATPNRVTFEENSAGNWSLALPTSYSNYTNLTITGRQAPYAAGVYDTQVNEVAGLTASQPNPGATTNPTVPLEQGGDVRQALKEVGTPDFDETFVGGEFATHDGYRAATAEYEVVVSGGISLRTFRDEFMTSLFGLDRSRFSGLPNSAGASYQEFKAVITTVMRPNTSGDAQRLVTLAVTPLQTYDNDQRVKFRISDLTNTTNLAEEVDTPEDKCRRFTAKADRPKVEFYWVLDQSGSMTQPLNEAVIDFSTTLQNKIQNTAVDYKMGVTNMAPATQGRLRVPPAWHTGASTFQAEVQQTVTGCTPGGNIHCDSSDEFGLQVAREGIRYMRGAGSQTPTTPEEIRPNSEVITIFMSDEPANSVEESNYPPGISSVQDYVQWFKGRTTAFSVAGSQGCEEGGDAYRQVAQATGGTAASICADDLTNTIERIVQAANESTSNFRPRPKPISSSLKVFVNEEWVPRSTENGYTYSARNNTVAFFGDYRPDPDKFDDQDEAPDRVAIIYETYEDKCKKTGNGAFNCRSRP